MLPRGRVAPHAWRRARHARVCSRICACRLPNCPARARGRATEHAAYTQAWAAPRHCGASPNECHTSCRLWAAWDDRAIIRPVNRYMLCVCVGPNPSVLPQQGCLASMQAVQAEYARVRIMEPAKEGSAHMPASSFCLGALGRFSQGTAVLHAVALNSPPVAGQWPVIGEAPKFHASFVVTAQQVAARV